MKQFAVLRKDFLAKSLEAPKNIVDRHEWTFCNRMDLGIYKNLGAIWNSFVVRYRALGPVANRPMKEMESGQFLV